MHFDAPAVEPMPVPQRVAEPEPPRPAPSLPRITLDLPPDSGLELVETKHAAPAPTDEVEPPRARRVRPPRVAFAEEPLQMVETTNKDSPPATE